MSALPGNDWRRSDTRARISEAEMTDHKSDTYQDASPSNGAGAHTTDTQHGTGPAATNAQPIALENTRVPDLLARIADRIAEAESQDKAGSGTEQGHGSWGDETDEAGQTATGQASSTGGLKRGLKQRGTFTQAETALNKLAQQSGVGKTVRDDAGAGRPWSETDAEALVAYMEDAGLAEPPAAPDLLIGAGDKQPAEQRVSNVYLQPDAQELGQKWFEDRFEALSRRLDATAGDAEFNSAHGMAPLLEKFDALEARFSELLGYTSGNGEKAVGGGLHDIELCIAEIATQLEATTAEMKRIESIEQQVSQISKNLAARGDQATGGLDGGVMLDVTAIADKVAERLAARPMAFAGSNGGLEPGDAAGLGELSAVVKEFMRERRSEGEHANAVLDTMQQTIIRVLDRMDAIEANGTRAPNSSQHLPAAMPAPATPAAAVETAATHQPEWAAATTRGQPATLDSDPQGIRDAFDYYNRQTQQSEAESADAQSLNRLQRAVGQLNDTEPSQPAAHRPSRASEPEQPRPVTSRIRADFIAAARQAAASAGHADEARGRPTPDLEMSPEGLEAERARFAAAARKAAANAGRRISNDDNHEGNPNAGDDGFSIGKFGANLSAGWQPKTKGSSRVRLLVAALAIMAVGLGATKYLMSRSASMPAPQVQSSTLPHGSTIPGEQSGTSAAVSKISATAQELADARYEPVAAAQPQQEIQPETAQFSPAGDNSLQQTAVSPTPEVTNDGQPVSGGAGSTARQALPAAMVGPLSLRLAAANGDASAEFQVASRFADGKGVTQDFDEAIKWYTRSASRGFALSQYRLGTLYERGLGVDKDPHRARIWYERAAAHNNIKAMHNLAVLAAGSGGNQPDYTTAAKWFSEAADRGLGDSQFNLAILYQNGLGVPQDNAMAYKWFSLAAAGGDGEATKRMTAVAATLGKQRVKEIENSLRGWMRKPADKMANDPHYAGQAWQRQS